LLLLLKILDDEHDDDDKYEDNWGVHLSSAVLSVSMSTRCGTLSGCDGWDGVYVWRVAYNVLNKQLQISDKGCPMVWWLGEMLTTQHGNGLLHYAILHKTSEWDWSFWRL